MLALSPAFTHGQATVFLASDLKNNTAFLSGFPEFCSIPYLVNMILLIPYIHLVLQTSGSPIGLLLPVRWKYLAPT